MLSAWDRREAELVFVWELEDAHLEDRVRPTYYGQKKVNHITDEEEIVYPRWKRWLKIAAVFPVILVFFILILAVSPNGRP